MATAATASMHQNSPSGSPRPTTINNGARPQSMTVPDLLAQLLITKPKRAWYAQSFGRHMPRVSYTWTLTIAEPRAFVRMVVSVYAEPLIRQFDSGDDGACPQLQCASGDIEIFLLDRQTPGPNYLGRFHNSDAVRSLSAQELWEINALYPLRYFSPECAMASVNTPRSPKRVGF